MRASMSLNGQWKFCPAFDEISADQRWMDPDFDPDNPNTTPKTEGDVGWVAEEFDVEDWMDIDVPASWNSAIDDLWSYEGHGWYRRTIHVPASWAGKRVLFHSEGANYRTALYVNGKPAGAHEGGYTPFDIEIGHLVRPGETNTIAVAVENIPNPDRAPGGQFGWVNHGGLYRDVELVMTDNVYIDDVTVTTELTLERVDLSVEVSVACREGDVVNRSVELTLNDPSGKPVAVPSTQRHKMAHVENGRATVTFDFTVPNAKLWTPDEPHLYELTITLNDTATEAVGDEWRHRIGLRTISIEGTTLLLNGEPVFLKGLNKHELYPDTGRTHTTANAAKDIDLAIWLGANAFRGHYSFHREHYELCDERGILNVAEVPLYMWGRPLCEADGPGALVAAKEQFAEMHRALKNHPSVIIWSISNENLTKPGKPDEDSVALAKQTVDGNREMVELAKSLDSSRPVVEFSNSWPEDPVHGFTDITTINVLHGRENPAQRRFARHDGAHGREVCAPYGGEPGQARDGRRSWRLDGARREDGSPAGRVLPGEVLRTLLRAVRETPRNLRRVPVDPCGLRPPPPVPVGARVSPGLRHLRHEAPTQGSRVHGAEIVERRVRELPALQS